MAQIKVSELEGARLDYWVGRANDLNVAIDEDKECYECKQEGIPTIADYFPSTDWSVGGPIIERERISIDARPSGKYDAIALTDGKWLEGPTPLIAAMRCFVASKFGEEVEDD